MPVLTLQGDYVNALSTCEGLILQAASSFYIGFLLLQLNFVISTGRIKKKGLLRKGLNADRTTTAKRKYTILVSPH